MDATNTWRYENAGTADSLIVSGTTLTDLPETKSVTGTAFYQTAHAKCFDLPATAEVWMKFDVYFNDSQRWRAYNEGNNGATGIAAQPGGRLSFFSNNTNPENFSGICKANQLQTVLLHMKAGTTDGIVEAWVDGTKIYTYTGDVNHGQDFAGLYLQSDGSGTFFSNVIISNAEIGLDENVGSQTGEKVTFLFDVKATIKRVLSVEFTFDTSLKIKNRMNEWRYYNAGTADTLLTTGTTLTDLPASKSKTGTAFYQTARTKCFDLPATAEVWIKFDLYHYSGASRFRIFDDKSGSIANGFALMNASSTKFALWSWNGAVSDARKIFDGVLKGDTLQTWLLHMKAGTTDGLLELWCDGNFVGSWTGNVNNGADFANIYFQTDNSQNIFSNVIISNAEIGLDENVGFQAVEFLFDIEATIRNLTEVEFLFDVKAQLENTLRIPAIRAHFNHLISSITLNRGSPQKIALPQESEAYVRGVAAGIVKVYSDVDSTGETTGEGFNEPNSLYAHVGECETVFIQIAESTEEGVTVPESLVITNLLISDGATDSDYEALTDNTRQILAADVSYVTTYITEFLSDIAVWYAFATEFLWDVQRNIPLEINLNAIADTDPEPQVAPLHMLKAPVLRGEGGGDAIRAIQNTPGLQSLELNIAAGQLSSRLKFTSTDDIPVLGAVTGRYLDYSYSMGVTRKSMSKSRNRPSDGDMPQASQNSAAYFTYDCWYDVVAMLYTQINYTIGEDDDEDDAEVFDVQVDSGSKTVYLTPTGSGEYTQAGEVSSEGSVKKRSTAKGHLSYIAKALGLKPETAFQDFIVDLELEQVDVTPADLISKIFGWTARIPNRLISIFPAEINGELCLCAVQRGFKSSEGGGRDISNVKQSVARIEQKLVRTLWGSSVKSSTYTVETHYGGLYVLLPPPTESPDGRTTYTYSEVNGGYLLATSTTQNDDGSVTTVNYEYSEVDGVYTCALEDAITRDEDDEIIGRTYTSHHILTPSQQLSRMFDEDGNLIATAVSSHLPGLYERKQTLLAPRVEVKENDLPAIPLLDTSFPIIDGALVDTGDDSSQDEEDKLLTFAVLADCIKKLNLATQETVRLDIYDYEHVFNMNDDKVIEWNRNQYFLESNTAIANQHIANKQSLTLVRWILYGGNGY